jgi:hypothetical protein
MMGNRYPWATPDVVAHMSLPQLAVLMGTEMPEGPEEVNRQMITSYEHLKAYVADYRERRKREREQSEDE